MVYTSLMTIDIYRKPVLLVLILLSFALYLPLLGDDINRLSVGRFIGFVGLQFIWWQVVLGGRQLTRYLTPDLVWINKVHQLSGTYGFLIILLHPLLMISLYGTALVWPPSFDSTFDIGVRAGMTALVLLAFIWLASALLRGRLGWRWWKRLHMMAYIVFPLLFLHMVMTGSSIQRFSWLEIWLYTIVTAFWGILLLRITHWAGLTKHRYSVTAMTKVGKDVTRFRLQPLDRGVRPRPGQFAYLQGWRYGEAHPFTISHYDSQSGELSFSIKAVGPYSRRLTTLRPGDTVFVDGPYGVFTREIGHTDRPIVVIAGGIGITPFLRHLEKGVIAHLFWGCHTQADFVYQDKIRASGVKSHFVLSGQTKPTPGYTVGVIDIELVERTLDQPLSKYDFYLCGPSPMMKSLNKQLAGRGVKPAQIRQEKFSL